MAETENNEIGTVDDILAYNTCMYDKWHQRLGHPGVCKMERIIRDNLLP